jgi:thymidylate kinase
MRDRLGFDRASGGLVHLHVHEQLVLGTSGVKNHRVPVEALVLDGGRTLHGVRAPSAELELLLLALRAPLKVSRLRLLRRWRKDATKTLQSALVREMGFLLPDVDPERFREALGKTGLALDPDTVRRFAERARDRTLTPRELRGFRTRVLRALRPHRRDPAWRAAARALRARLLATARVQRLVGSRGRRLPGRGRLLALVGADGSGKSTLAADLRAWLGWKLRVEDAYFGIPKSDPVYRALQRARRRLGWRWLDSERWLYTARARLAAWRRARRAVAAGAVVICDRYPLSDLWLPPEPMDGPRLAGRPLAGRERAAYQRIGPPDRAFVLRAPLATLQQRDPGVDPALHARKAEAVNALRESTLYAVVDADRPYEAVLLDLKRKVWDAL